MASGRGATPPNREEPTTANDMDSVEYQTSRSVAQEPIGQEPDEAFLAQMSEQPQFTVRALLVGTLIGVLIAFSNTYFGLQTGWISGMAMPSALIGFAYFKGLRTLSRSIGGAFERAGFGQGFSEVENVLVQTVAGSVGTMPLGCGFVGVVPALEFLLKPSETPEILVENQWPSMETRGVEEMTGIRLPLSKLVVWALGLCFFGVVFAVPLRKEVIVREKLKFPSGTATALMIGVLHGGTKTGAEGNIEQHNARRRRSSRKPGLGDDDESRALMSDVPQEEEQPISRRDSRSEASQKDWQRQIKLLTTSFAISGGYVRITPFIAPRYRLSQTVPVADRTPDVCFLLHPAIAFDSISGSLHVTHVGMGYQSQPSICRPRHHHGSGDDHPHASRRSPWMGCPFAHRQTPGLGIRTRQRLEYRL
jgi:hypothetical protein